jgi:hypothetical protein
LEEEKIDLKEDIEDMKFNSLEKSIMMIIYDAMQEVADEQLISLV